MAYWTGRRRPELSGELHPAWRGDEVSEAGARRRLRARYPRPRRCRICRLPGVRCARNGNPRDDHPGNVDWLCRGCLARYHRRRRRPAR